VLGGPTEVLGLLRQSSNLPLLILLMSFKKIDLPTQVTLHTYAMLNSSLQLLSFTP